MKIIASIPQKYGSPSFILEATAEEIAALCLNPHPYPHVMATDTTGKIVDREIKDLQVGDVVSSDTAKGTRETISSFLTARSEIEKAMATLRGSMTRLSNLTFDPAK
jgi:hypothetical protein